MKEESEEGTPERRLDSTPQKAAKETKKSKTIPPNRASGKKSPDAASATQRKSKNVQFHKVNWSNVPRKIDCWKNVPPPDQQATLGPEEEESETYPVENIKESFKNTKSTQRRRTQKPVAVTNLNLNEHRTPSPEEIRLVESLSKQGEEIEILEMNEDEIPYK